MSSKLDQFRKDAPVEVEAEEAEAPSRLLNKFSGRVLGIDQSLSNTGWAWLQTGGLDGPAVIDTGNITTDPFAGYTGYEETFLRATLVYSAVRNLLDVVKPHLVVHEMPSVRPNRRAGLKDRDGSIATVMSVRCAARDYGVTVLMLNAQHVKKVMTGKANAEKKAVAEAVRQVMPTLISRRPKLRLNEHTYDAMALALVIASEQEN